MRWAIKFAVRVCVPVVCLVVGTGCPGTSVGDGDGDGDGGEEKPPDCKYTTGESKQNFHETPIPAGVFDFDGRICEPFGGEIRYVGRPIDESEFGRADTIVNRDGDPISPSDPVGTEGTVDIEIVALSLASTEPITVFCDGAPTEWNVRLDLSEATASKGALTATKEHANGGTATSTIFVCPRLTFAYVDDANVVRVFDAVAEGLAAVQFDTTFPWAHALDPNDPDPGTDFLIGVNSPPGAQKQRIQGTTDPTTLQDVDTKCIRYVSPGGNHVHETCTVDSGSA